MDGGSAGLKRRGLQRMRPGRFSQSGAEHERAARHGKGGRLTGRLAWEDIALRGHVAFLIGGVVIGAIACKFARLVASQINLTALAPPPRFERPCDPTAGKTAIVVVGGQSNAANYGNTRYTAREAVDNFDPSTGKCFGAADPLLGADGAGGNFATRLGDILIQAGRYDRVILVPIAVQGASLSVLNSEEAERIENVISKLQA